MESLNDAKKQLGQQEIGAEKQLPSGANSVERFTQHATGLVEDVKEWVDLKVQLIQLEIEGKVDHAVNQLILGVILAFVAFLVLLFGLIAIGFGLGAWLGHPGWGFLVVTVVLFVILLMVYLIRPHLTGMIEKAKKNVDTSLKDMTKE